MNLAILWRLRLEAWGLLLVPWLRIRLMLGACSSISGPNLFQFWATRLSSNSSVDHWATLQLLTLSVTCFIFLFKINLVIFFRVMFKSVSITPTTF